MGFPCNQFGSQEPGSNEDVKRFAAGYNVKFDMFAKINVNGSDAHPLWNYLKDKQGGTLGKYVVENLFNFRLFSTLPYVIIFFKTVSSSGILPSSLLINKADL